MITLQTHLDGRWHDAARLNSLTKRRVAMGPSTLDYDFAYCVGQDPKMTGAVHGHAALSVRLPLDVAWHRFAHWPPPLLDLLPQGHARSVLSAARGLNPDSNACDLNLLLRSGGGPISNVRVKEAWEAEQLRIAGPRHPPFDDQGLYACPGMPGSRPGARLGCRLRCGCRRHDGGVDRTVIQRAMNRCAEMADAVARLGNKALHAPH